MAELSQMAPSGLALIDWDERNWLYARAAIAHNGIRSPREIDLCSIAPEGTRWLIPVKLAKQNGLPINRAIAVQDDRFIVADTAPADECAAKTNFQYRFQWSETSLRRLDR
jgi:hypothetical protein